MANLEERHNRRITTLEKRLKTTEGNVQGVAAGLQLVGGGVTSVNGKIGPVVTLTTDDISEGVTNKYYLDERVDDRVAALLVAGTNITLTYNDGANTLTIDGGAGGSGLTHPQVLARNWMGI